MHLNNDTRDTQLVDLGSAVEETKGSQMGQGDSLNQQQQTGIGLADD